MCDEKLQFAKRKHFSEGTSAFANSQDDTILCDISCDLEKIKNSVVCATSSDTRLHRDDTSKSETSKKVASVRGRKNKKKVEKVDDSLFSDISIKEEQSHTELDINIPSIPTRSKWRLYNRRKSTRVRSSASSTVASSDARGTKTEPVIIDISDNSSDETFTVANTRPNRIARVQGELLRKYSKMHFRNKVKDHNYKDSSDSSSEEERVRRKRKYKKVHYQSSASKRKRFLQVKHLMNKRNLGMRNQTKNQATPTILPATRSNVNARSKFKQKRNPGRRLGRPPTVSVSTKQRLNSSIKLKTHQGNRKVTRSSFNDLESSAVEGNRKADLNVTLDSTQTRKSNKNELRAAFLQSKKVTRSNSFESRTSIFLEKKDEKNSFHSETEVFQNINPINVNCSDTEIPTFHNGKPNNNNSAESTGMFHGKNNCSVQGSLVITERNKSKESFSETTLSINNENSYSGSDVADCLSSTVSNDINFSEAGTVVSVPLHKIERKPCMLSKTNLPNDEEIDDKNLLDDSSLRTKCKKLKLQQKVIARKRGRPKLNTNPYNESTPIKDLSEPPFLQSSFCFDVASKLPKCRECRMAVHKNSKKMMNSYCRFMEYRKLCINKAGVILNGGFSRPSDAAKEHLKMWLPQVNDPPKDLNKETSKALLEHIGDQFCDLIEQEKEARLLHIGVDDNMTWKRIVQGVREMCDVCSTTIFNIHWVCPVCGLAVCIDCYKMRKQGIIVEDEESQSKNRDEFKWLLCSLRQPHVQKDLVMAQIIPGQALWSMQKLLHEVRDKWKIPAYCKCNPLETDSSNKSISTGICKELMSFVALSFPIERNHVPINNVECVNSNYSGNRAEIVYDTFDIEISDAAMTWLDECNFELYETGIPLQKTSDCYNNDFTTFRSMLLQDSRHDNYTSEPNRVCAPFSTDDILEFMTKSGISTKDESDKPMLKHFSHRLPQASSGRDPLPIRIYTGIESNLAFSDVPHSWLCNGRLLLLHQPHHKNNLALFQEQWKRGQPILVKAVDERLDMNLWHPDGFCRDFGEIKNDLVDCKTGIILKNLPMKRFWEGFENFGKRMKDDQDEYMLLKLKDWPPGEDFSEKLPKRFQDLMRGLPLPDYTHRNGVLNLAGRLPPWFVRPDLGPKMYNAYGSALYPTKGTTNLHLDVSDAVNVMVYVGIPRDGNDELHIQAALKAIDEGGCDSLMRARVRSKGVKPGALWHIYNARDTDKIRDMLTKVAIERGEKLEANHDPIHDQSWYIDTELRKRLYQEYGVEGYAIAQCLGDAVFIPAGAPHQVRNLHSCVKVAEDFVSPENIAHCFKLTQEFRHLSDTHTNHEDKLQIKNIIYHVVRDALAHLMTSPMPEVYDC